MSEFTETVSSPEAVLAFWFEELTPKDWFDPEDRDGLDRTILFRFFSTHRALARSIGGAWRATPEGQLAAVLVLDQFPRNIYRGTPMAFATDVLALREAKLAIASSAHEKLPAERRAFFFMPFEHSEDLADQDRSVALFEKLGNPEYLKFAESHRDVIARFGRFPHRNATLKRRSTRAELGYLASEENTGWGQK
ncbi:DUF924 family protein [Martelella endophytica]|uniref:Membrane protein n=1 Tax=Martelella endophytica TaxID=1486262 RepID=A0A0D5LTQ8_MAREN|nr:DUF924 family protein [Martelella endophytica]AJY47446.1 membrane protein [Martelella endophytica]